MVECSRSIRFVKRQRIRTKIFEAAASLIREKGYSDMTVRMICAKADVSVGMFYRNFDSKDDVLSFFYECTAEAYKSDLQDHLARMAIKDQLINFYTWIARFTANFGLEFVRDFLNPTRKSVRSDTAENHVVSIGKDLLDSAVARKEITLSENRTTFEVTHDILTIVKGSLLDWAISGGTYDVAAYVRAFLARTLESLL
jgi:Transcriptional regulator